MQADLIRCPRCSERTSRWRVLLAFIRTGEWRGVWLLVRLTVWYPQVRACLKCHNLFEVEQTTHWRIR